MLNVLFLFSALWKFEIQTEVELSYNLSKKKVTLSSTKRYLLSWTKKKDVDDAGLVVKLSFSETE